MFISRLKIKCFYDATFKAKHGADSINAVRRVMAQAQNIYMSPTLTTKVVFEIDSEVDFKDEKWNAPDDM
jgi:hypothetical protein